MGYQGSTDDVEVYSVGSYSFLLPRPVTVRVTKKKNLDLSFSKDLRWTGEQRDGVRLSGHVE